MEYETSANALAAIGWAGQPPPDIAALLRLPFIGGRATVSGHSNGLVAVVRFRR
jgi:hypothetical protein